MGTLKNTPLRWVAMLLIIAAWSCGVWSQRLTALMPVKDQFMQALGGIRDELGGGYRIDIVDVNGSVNVKTIARQCKKGGVEGLIIMDSKAISLARQLEKEDSFFVRVPKFVIMTLQIEQAIKGLHAVAGVRFEVPAYTLVTTFRALSSVAVDTVGVIYRSAFTPEVLEGIRLLARENIVLVPVNVDSVAKKRIVSEESVTWCKLANKILYQRCTPQAVWLLADNVLVNTKSVREFWLPERRKRHVPVLVPLEQLIAPQVGLGVFSAAPDYSRLGIQTATLITQVFEDDVLIDSVGVEPLISVRKSVNASVAREIGWPFKQNVAAEVDTIIAP